MATKGRARRTVRRSSRRAYRLTQRRRYAILRAQKVSAQRRRGKRTKIAIGVMAGVGAAAYLGYRHRGTIAKTAKNWKNAVQPGHKEGVRVANALYVAHPSQTTISPPRGHISSSARDAAAKERARLTRLGMPPIYNSAGENIGGPDRRIYNEDDSVNSAAMTQKGVRRSLAHARKKTQGKRTRSKVKKNVMPTKTIQELSFDQWLKDYGGEH